MIHDIEKFRDAMLQYGIACQDEIIDDGQIHRFIPKGDNNPNGWYVLNNNKTFMAGAIGCWKRDIKEKWCSKPRKELTPAESKKLQSSIKKANAEIKKEQEKRNEEAKIKANKIWNNSTPNVDIEHPYLTKKKIKPYNIRSSSYKGNTNLIIPLYDNDGTLHTLQSIYPKGDKRFLSGGAKKGHYLQIGKPSNIIYIAEGYATAATIHEATEQCVIVAFDSNSLLPVAKNIRKKYLDKKIVIAADNDALRKEGNIGVEKANEAAKAINAQVTIPNFKDNSTEPSDFNDLFLSEGMEEVQKQITANCVDITTTQEKEFGIPKGFIVNDEGVFFIPINKDGAKLPPARICSRIDVVARTRDTDGFNHGRQLLFKDDDDVVHKWAMPMEALASDGADYRRTLLGMGVIISSNKQAREKLTDYLSSSSPKEIALCVNRTGWHNDCFVFPDEVIGQKQKDEKIIFQSMGYDIKGFKTNGSLEEWQKNISKYCAGNSRLVLAVSAAFAAPLLRLLGEESGGFHFNGASSIGKSTALKIACSVWGDEDRLQTWRTTSNGLEGVAAQHNDSLLNIDEMSQVEPKEAGEIAYMLANGMGKNRCKKDGSLRNNATWELLFLSSGEVGLEAHVSQSGKKTKAGQQVRFLDIPADAEKGLGLFETLHGFADGSEFARHLNKQAQSHYGLPIREFLRKLIESYPQKELKSILEEMRKAFYEKLGVDEKADGQVKRAANRFALLAIAGELATRLGITDWEEGEASKAISTCFHAWLDKRGGEAAFEEIQLIQQVNGFFQKHYPIRFINWNNNNEGVTTFDKPVYDKAGFFHKPVEGGDGVLYGVEKREQFFYVEVEIFKKELCAGFEYHQAAKICIKKKILNPSKDGRPTQVKRPKDGTKPRRFYVFNSNAFEESEGKEE